MTVVILPIKFTFVYTLFLIKSDKLLAELAGVLAKIANGSPENTLAVCAGGAIPKLVPMLKSRSKVVVEQTIQALINITGHGLPGPRDEVINNNGVVLLLDVLRKTKKVCFHSAYVKLHRQ